VPVAAYTLTSAREALMTALVCSVLVALAALSGPGAARADDCSGHSVQLVAVPGAKRAVALRVNEKRQWEVRVTAPGAAPGAWQPLPRLRAHAHVAVIASDATTRFVVVDMSGDTDFADRVLVFDVQAGRVNLVASFGLESILAPLEFAKVSRSISHLHWLAYAEGKFAVRLAASGKALELDLMSGRTATIAFGPETLKSPE
jgi:hypothetical protein